MKIFYSALTFIFCLISFSFITPIESTGSQDKSLMALASLNDVVTADSITAGAITLTEKETGTEIEVNRYLTDQEISDIVRFIPVVLSDLPTDEPLTASQIIKYILSFLGSLLTSIILYFLHKRWPDIFTSQKLKNYKKNFDA